MWGPRDAGLLMAPSGQAILNQVLKTNGLALSTLLLLSACGEGGGPALPDAGEDPCNGSSAEAVPRLCVWASERDLNRLARNPNARTEVPAAVTWEGRQYEDVELEVHGGLSRTFEKLSYRLAFEDEEDARFDFFGTGEESVERVVLQASWVDRTFARQKLAMDLSRGEGGLAPRVGHVQLFLNGSWHGLYLTIERIDENYLTRQGLDKDGFLYKAESHTANWTPREDRPLSGFELVRGEEDDAEEVLLELFSALDATPLTDEAYDAQVLPRLHIADWIAWHLVMTFAQNSDTFSKNYYLHRPCAQPTCEARIVMWDADGTFGNKWDGTDLAPDDAMFLNWFGANNHAAGRYFQVSGYKQDYLEQYQDALQSRLRPADLNARLDAFVDTIRPFAERDLARWQPDYRFDDELAELRAYLGARHAVMTEVVDDAL